MTPTRAIMPVLNSKKTGPSWLVTFADLLGIVLAMFVLIYATSDRHAPRLENTILSMRDALFDEKGSGRTAVLSQNTGRLEYKTALLKKYVEAIGYWSIDDRDDRVITLELIGKPLETASGDGLWLDVIERFDVPVTLTLSGTRGSDPAMLLASAQALLDERAARGLKQPWTVYVHMTQEKTAPMRAVITLGTDQDAQGLAFAPNDYGFGDAVKGDGQ